jgi:hypothetical protein
MYGIDLEIADKASPLSIVGLGCEVAGNLANALQVDGSGAGKIAGAYEMNKSGNILKAQLAAKEGARTVSRLRYLGVALKGTGILSAVTGGWGLGYGGGARLNAGSHALAELVWGVKLH